MTLIFVDETLQLAAHECSLGASLCLVMGEKRKKMSFFHFLLKHLHCCPDDAVLKCADVTLVNDTFVITIVLNLTCVIITRILQFLNRHPVENFCPAFNELVKVLDFQSVTGCFKMLVLMPAQIHLKVTGEPLALRVVFRYVIEIGVASRLHCMPKASQPVLLPLVCLKNQWTLMGKMIPHHATAAAQALPKLCADEVMEGVQELFTLKDGVKFSRRHPHH
mmetsp:Transcript_53627/g.95333  ORF Transcript_53627/g.95333 Transcript_53627/m.95333 type:complete len:221 (+) Transcript_53627:556-1218(+)